MASPTAPTSTDLTTPCPTKVKGCATFDTVPVPVGNLIFSETPLLTLDADSPTAHAALPSHT
ncbi:hypothetical protein DPSP01_010186 [Paraphaeosphaeria sporulosa]